MKFRLFLAFTIGVLAAATALGAGKPTLAPVPIALVPGGGTVHVEADDQDGNRLMPGLFSWAVPAGASIGIQVDTTGWLLSAPADASPGTYSIMVQYIPNPALSPTAAITVGRPITAIRIVVTPP